MTMAIISQQQQQQQQRWLAVLTLIIFFAAYMVNGSSIPDPYRTLSIKRGASQSEIKQAYRKLTLQYHPDKNQQPGADAIFLRVSEAYDILSDPTKRSNYDAYGTVDPQEIQNRKHQTRFHRYYTPSAGYYQGKMRYDDVSERLTTLNYDFVVSAETPTVRDVSFWVIVVHAARCPECHALKPAWQKCAAKLKQSAVRTGAVSSDYESALVRTLGVRRLPAIVGVSIDENGRRTTVRMAKPFNAHSIIEFSAAQMQRFATVSTTLDKDARSSKICVVLRSSRQRRRAPLLLQRVAVKYRHAISVSYVADNSIEQSKLEVYRDPGAPVSTVSPVPQSWRELLQVLEPLLYWRVPEINGGNYFPWCYVQAPEGHLYTNVPNWRPSRSSDDHTYCLLVFTTSQKLAWTALKTLLTEDSDAHPLLLSGRLRLGWMHRSRQKAFIRRLGRGDMVLLNPVSNEVYVFHDTRDGSTLSSRVARLLDGELSTHKVVLPYPDDAVALGADLWWFADTIEWSSMKSTAKYYMSSLASLVSSLGSVLFVLMFLGGGAFL